MVCNFDLPLAVGRRARENMCLAFLHCFLLPKATMSRAFSCVFGGPLELRVLGLEIQKYPLL